MSARSIGGSAIPEEQDDGGHSSQSRSEHLISHEYLYDDDEEARERD
jgi:hypothetical protein